MSHKSNSEIERYYFNLFAAHYILPNGNIEFTDKPDVIIHGAEVIGIEIANFYLCDGNDPTSEQVQKKRRLNVLKKSQEIYELMSGLKHELTVSFDPRNPIIDPVSVANRLANLALAPESTPGSFFTGYGLSHFPELHSVFISQSQYADSEWRTAQVHNGKNLSISRLLELTSQKDGKIDNYQCCDSYWLLLVVDFMDAAQDQEIIWPSDAEPLKSKFDKVLIYKPQFATYLDVPLR
jgi:hypothetical protein